MYFLFHLSLPSPYISECGKTQSLMIRRRGDRGQEYVVSLESCLYRLHKKIGWFMKRFDGDDLDIAENVSEARELLAGNAYDAIFLDHDLLPHHYESNDHDDFANTGYAIAEWLCERADLQRASTIIVHTRNADAAVKMVEKLRETGRNVEYCAFPMLDLKIKNYWKR